MIKSFFSKWFNRSSANRPQVPKAFQEKKRSIFVNKYAGLVYFLVVWHSFGYLFVSYAKESARKEGIKFSLYSNDMKLICGYFGNAIKDVLFPEVKTHKTLIIGTVYPR